MSRADLTALVVYAITDCRIRQISWRETKVLILSRVLLSDGSTDTRPDPGGSFGKILGRMGLYTGGLAYRFRYLWQALDLLGQPIEHAEVYPEARPVRCCRQCRFGTCDHGD